MIRHIVAIDNQRGMAKNGAMPPWKLHRDEQYFTEQTLSHGGEVLMGRKTFVEALHERPLTNRTNYVVTRDSTPITGAVVMNNLEDFISDWPPGKDLWVIGGSEIFAQTMGQADELYITEIEALFDCDKFYPPYTGNFELVSKSALQTENDLHYYFCVYQPKKS